jgi:hypothetical protein
MAELVFALPVSVEQIAVVIRQMNLDDQKRLIELVPTLQQAASQPRVRTVEQTRNNISRLQAEILAVINNQPFSADEPFWGDLTLKQYHALPEEQKAKLWDEWGVDNVMELEEQEVALDALPAWQSNSPLHRSGVAETGRKS